MREASFIVLIGRFPPSINMETLATALERIRSVFPPKLRLDGAFTGSGDPRGRPTPGGAPRVLPLAG